MSKRIPPTRICTKRFGSVKKKSAKRRSYKNCMYYPPKTEEQKTYEINLAKQEYEKIKKEVALEPFVTYEELSNGSIVRVEHTVKEVANDSKN
jgi:hypothetical protein